MPLSRRACLRNQRIFLLVALLFVLSTATDARVTTRQAVTAECGQNAPSNQTNCPLNACCSGSGLCGIAAPFCGDECQGDTCGTTERPQGQKNTNALSYARRIGYFDLRAPTRGCNEVRPSDLPVAPLTNLYLAHVNFDDNFEIVDTASGVVAEAGFLKLKYPGLKVNIVVGGWDFNSPPEANLFSKMASKKSSRQAFILSCTLFLRKYGLDGLDLDWQFPAAPDRGGSSDDTANYVLLLQEMSEAFKGTGWQITATIPTGYWYLRGYDLQGMSQYVDWFNILTFEVHESWDREEEWTGPYIRGHSNTTQIDEALDLLWRNNIKPENLVFGLAFFGQSFTLADENCFDPNGVCQFASRGVSGWCSNETGVLTFSEITLLNSSAVDVSSFYQSNTSVKYTQFNGNQWVSYDDAQSLEEKKRFLSSRGFSGVFVWTMDMDNAAFDALSGVFGDFSHLELSGGPGNPNAGTLLADAFGAYTGQDCFASALCTDGSAEQKGPGQVCPAGYLSVDQAHNPLQRPGRILMGGQCDKGWFREICCPQHALPKNCAWTDGCNDHCSQNQFRLNRDTYATKDGQGACFVGERQLCCNSTPALTECSWSGCQGPLDQGEAPQCPANTTFYTSRLDGLPTTGPRWCSDDCTSPDHESFSSALCCPQDRGFANCAWSNTPQAGELPNDPEVLCKPRACPRGKVKVTSALNPMTNSNSSQNDHCDNVVLEPGVDAEHSYCCDPPAQPQQWPVDPANLWQNYTGGDDTDTLWAYVDQHDYNNADPVRAAYTAEDGSDAFGFAMLHGPGGTIDSTFANAHTIVRADATLPKTRRSILTRDPRARESVYDHGGQTFHAYCNYPPGSPQCARIFIDGAEDTIVQMPDHVGDGPFARIVRMQPVEIELPSHHILHRALDGLTTGPVYEVTIDYDFYSITPKREGEEVQLRIEYTNLLSYWNDVIATPGPISNANLKRSEKDRRSEWRERVRSAAEKQKGRQAMAVDISKPWNIDKSMSSSAREKRGWFTDLFKFNKEDAGVIPFGWARSWNLFNIQKGCPGATFNAGLRMDVDVELRMDAVYAYHFAGTLLGFRVDQAFAYLGTEPFGEFGIRLAGYATAQWGTGTRTPLIPTLTFPGMSVAGLLTVGPSLDVYGEIRGKVTLSGQARAGARVTFGRTEVYWPQDESAQLDYDRLIGQGSTASGPFFTTGANDTGSDGASIVPNFSAGVQLDAQLDFIVSPEANIGLTVGGKLTAGFTLADAQLTAYMRGDLSFQASAKVSTETSAFDYRYGVYFLYNLGYKAKANILFFGNWALGPRELYTMDQVIKIYENKGTIPLFGPGDTPPAGSSGTNGTTARRKLNMVTFSGPDHSSDGQIFARADSDSDSDSGANSPLAPQPSCPKRADGAWEMPELRLNCDYMKPQIVPKADPNSVTQSDYPVPGLCDPIKSLGMLPRVLTYEMSATTQRRNSVCPNKKCEPDTLAKQATTGRTGPKDYILSCDEFPFASTEEGGDEVLPANQRSATCVSDSQNYQAGQCIKLLSNLESDWGHMDPSITGNRVENWKKWTLKSSIWNLNSNDDPARNSGRQRITKYPTKQNPIKGATRLQIENAGGNADGKLNWVFRRNYTFSLADDVTDGSKFWSATNVKFKDNNNAVGLSDILCAVNTFSTKSNPNFIRTQAGKANGWCNSTPHASAFKGWPNVRTIKYCNVDFTPVSGSKRWVISGARYLEDSDEDLVITESGQVMNKTSFWAQVEAGLIKSSP